MTMEASSSVLALSFALGLVHALDPDHLMTISSLSARPGGREATLRFAASWGIGHGGLLVVIAAAAALFSRTLPASLPHTAERVVGIILVVAGATAVHQLLRNDRPAPLGAPTWRERMPFAIGLVHGLAGSAAVLALVPLAMYRPFASIGYVAVFSVGVLTAMMCFAMVLAKTQRAMAYHLPAASRGLQFSVGIAALAMGGCWIYGA